MFKRLLVFIVVLTAPAAAGAGLPLITDDAGTQGRGKYLFEAGGEYDRDREMIGGALVRETDASVTATLTYGAAPRVDAFITSSSLRTVAKVDGAGTTKAAGPTDTAVGLKWRMYEHKGLSFAVKPAASFPTGDDEKGLGSGRVDYSGLFIVSEEAEPWEFSLNLGYGRNNNTLGERVGIWHVSLAAVYEAAEHIKLCADAGVDTNRDITSEVEPAYLLAGVIYEMTEDFGLSFGVKAGLTKPATDWAVLPGATYRF